MNWDGRSPILPGEDKYTEAYIYDGSTKRFIVSNNGKSVYYTNSNHNAREETRDGKKVSIANQLICLRTSSGLKNGNATTLYECINRQWVSRQYP
jgi:hypothetical protein